MSSTIYQTRASGEMHERLQATAHRRWNVGCGEWPLFYWTNCDADRNVQADVYATVPPIPATDCSLDEVYSGHHLEHLSYEDGREFLQECYRCLVPGGRLGVLVPDTREIFKRYLRGDIDNVGILHQEGRLTYYPIANLDAVCALFVFSTVQDSRHLWMYDQVTLRFALERAGFHVTGEIDRYSDPRVSVGAWYQFGYDAIKPEDA